MASGGADAAAHGRERESESASGRARLAAGAKTGAVGRT